MAWTSVIDFNIGEEVNTPEGIGTITRKSESSKTAQVNVGGQLFEFPAETISKPGGTGSGAGSNTIEVGDTVELLETSGGLAQVGETGTVTKKNGDSYIVNFPSQRGYSTSKEKIKKVAPNMAPNKPAKTGEFEKGDRVQVIGHPDRAGTVQSKTQRTLNIEWDDQSRSQIPKRDASNTIEHAGTEPTEPTQAKTHEEEERQEKRDERTEDQTAHDTADDLYGLLNLKKKLEDKIDSEVDGELKELRQLVKTKATLEVKVGDQVNTVQGLKHKQLEQLIHYSALRLSPLLVGMAGTGKTHAGEQVSKALGVPFYSMSVGAQTSKSDIIGYMAANGQYVTTHFRTAYEHGGVFLMDEVDAGNANVLIQINAALSNGLCAFPDMMVQRHEDFIFIASANTFGNGANRQYVGRNQLDAATLDRFAVIEWFVDDELEESLAVGLNGKAWYMAVRAAREYVAEKNIRALVSPRATQKGSKLLDVGKEVDEVINATLLASVPTDKKEEVRQVVTTVFEKFASQVKSQIKSTQVDDLFKAPF